MGTSTTEGGLRRRMPLRRATLSGGTVGTGGGGGPFFGSRAMRYYRLWIYTCNTALLAGSLAFCGAAIRTILLDFRRTLVPSLTLYQPSFLYAYLALATQGGALQLLGCVAAIRLSEKLLNAYWLLLLVLLFGDVVLGAFWAFKFERMCQELRPTLRIRFQQEYGTNAVMTTLWNRLQMEDECCGVTGPGDYQRHHLPPTNSAISSSSVVRWQMPDSCCSTEPSSNGTILNGAKCLHPFGVGCDEKLLVYLKSTASVLAILGYCVLAFLKLCFLGILRYEIREMIQKIRILRTELELTNINGGVPAAVTASGMGLGGGLIMRSATIEAECCHDEAAADSERESLLVRPLEADGLLSSPPPAPSTSKAASGKGGSGAAAGSYEMREFRRHDTATTNI